jgi:hypothetical protein
MNTHWFMEMDISQLWNEIQTQKEQLMTYEQYLLHRINKYIFSIQLLQNEEIKKEIEYFNSVS